MESKQIAIAVAVVAVIIVVILMFKSESFRNNIYTSGATMRMTSQLSATNQEEGISEYNMYKKARDQQRANALIQANSEKVIESMREQLGKEAKIASGDTEHDPRRNGPRWENFATDSLASTIKESVLQDKMMTEQGKSGFDFLLQNQLYRY